MIAVLFALKVRGAILIGILASTICWANHRAWSNFKVSLPPRRPSLPTFLQLQIPNILVDPKMISIIIIFIFLDLFDTVGTLVGVGEQGGFMVDGKLPESKTGTAFRRRCHQCRCPARHIHGYQLHRERVRNLRGRTYRLNQHRDSGSDAALALFFNPLIKMVGAGYPIGENTFLYPIVAPALIIIGSLMLKNVISIDWDDMTESIPHFLTLLADAAHD